MSQIFSHALPQVRAGDPDVTLSPTQQVALPPPPDDSSASAKQLLTQTGPGTVHVRIDGPQTALTADLIAGVYPAPGSETSPDEFLPHVALSRRTLPWERRGPQPAATVPWLALLVFSEAELTDAAGMRQAATVSVQRRTVASIPDAPTRNRLITTLGIPGSTEVSTLSVANGLLASILPTQAELALLCHVKRESTGTGDVDRAIVVANRLPSAAAPGGQKPPLHLAVLVSVERASELWTLPGIGSTTLLVLHHWRFRPSTGRDFEQVVRSIGYRPNGGVQRFGNLPVPVGPGQQAPLSGGFQGLLNPSGYLLTPLAHDQDVQAASYRGPLRPFGPQSRSTSFAIAAAPNEFASAPPGTPLDLSHATAFELGRLLALNDPAILEDLRGIRATFKPLDPPVAVNKLPDALQKPDWVVNPAWADQPWVNVAHEQLVKDHDALLGGVPAGDVSGLASALPSWGVGNLLDTVSGIGAAVSAPVTTLDVGTVTAQGLDTAFADVAAAAQE